MFWLVYALLAVVSASVQVITQKRELRHEHTLEYLIIRGFFLFLFSLVLLPQIEFPKGWEPYLISLVAAVVLAIALLYDNRSMKHMDLSTNQSLGNISPLIALFVAYLIIGETVSPVQLSGILLIVVGTYVLEMDHNHHHLLSPIKKLIRSRYSMLLIISLFFYGLAATLGRYNLILHFDPISYFVITWTTVTLILFAIHLYRFRMGTIRKVFTRHWKGIALPSFFLLLELIFYYKALELMVVGLVVAIYRTKTLITTFVGGQLFHEKHVVKKSVACLIMIVGAVILII